MKNAKTLTLLATIIGSGIVFLDGTVVTLALPKIAANLNGNFADMQWIIDGYTLTLSALLLLGGSLGDIFGRKKTYLLGLVGFSLTSLLCGLTPSMSVLIIFRVLQGLFGALLVPGSLAIINTNFDRDERGLAIGRWAAWSGAFTALGPLAGGYLLDVASWRWIFFINVPLAAICSLLAIRGIKESRDEEPRHVDKWGAGLAVLALAGITYGLIEGPANGWHAGSVAPLIAGIIASIVFIRYESKKKDPMVSLSLFGSRNFSGANLMTFAMYGALGGFLFALVIYLQTKLGYSSIKAGLSLLPITIMILLLSGRMGALSAKYGPRFFLTVGPLVAALGMFMLVNYNSGNGYLTFLLPRVLLFAIGLVMVVAPLTTTVLLSVPESNSGIASGINNAVSRVAGVIVVAVLGIFGTAHVYRFSMILCGLLAMMAGIVSYITIQDHPKTVRVLKAEQGKTPL